MLVIVTMLADGNLAISRDWNSRLSWSVVPVLLFVTGITFMLMMIAFSSVVIAATTIFLNLLSVAAAYGALTAVFVRGWLSRVLLLSQTALPPAHGG